MRRQVDAGDISEKLETIEGGTFDANSKGSWFLTDPLANIIFDHQTSVSRSAPHIHFMVKVKGAAWNAGSFKVLATCGWSLPSIGIQMLNQQ
jgi:hypothetical protein